jgi:uncharacterized phage protein gp47/JayE
MYDVTYENLLERMLARVSDKFDKREGSVIFDTHSPTAIELQILYTELNTILTDAYGDTAAREFLILRCKERGITPYEATHAVLKGVFTPANIDVTGKRFNIGEMNYIVTAKIADGEYQVQCETVGIVGNQYFGTMIPIEYIEGLETAELTEILIPGEDEEDTEVLRKRYFDSFEEKAFGGNVRDYLEKTNAIPGVGSTKVTRIWNADIRPAEMIPTAAVEAWYTSIIDTLDAEVAVWLAAVYTAAVEKKLTTGGTVLLTILNSDFDVPTNDTLKNTVQEVIDPAENAGEGYGLAPIGHVVTIQYAKTKPTAIKTNITFDTGYSWSNLQTAIDAVIEEYLLELRKAWADSDHLTVRISQIETRLLTIKGIVDIDNTKINGAADNLILGKYEVPIYGGATA